MQLQLKEKLKERIHGKQLQADGDLSHLALPQVFSQAVGQSMTATMNTLTNPTLLAILY